MAKPFVDGVAAFAADLNSLPWGLVAGGFAVATSNQAGILATADLTSLSVTFTATSTRYYKTSIKLHVQQLTAGGDPFAIIADGANVQKESIGGSATTNQYVNLCFFLIETGLSGSITRKLRAGTSAGTITALGAANSPMIISVEDIGGS